jgi:hypothetical protein
MSLASLTAKNEHTMKHRTFLMAALAIFAALRGSADSLELKSGKTLTGKYSGGTAGTIGFETGEGLQMIETSQVRALSFGGDAPKSAPAGAAHTAQADSASNAAPAAAGATATSTGSSAGGAVSVPAGTTLLVRMVDPVSSKDPQGKRFATTLESDLVVNGVTVAKAGTKVYGRIQSSQQARRYTGQSALDLRLTEVAVGPTLVPINTSGFAEASSRSGRKVARGAAAGAAIGAIADGGDGAGTGAAIGAVASGLKKGDAISVPPGTLLEFRLQQPVTINAAK